MLLFLRATSQVAMLAWIYGDCREVFDSDGKMKKEHFIDTSIFFRYDKDKTGKKSVWGGLGRLTEYRGNYDKSDCGG